MFIGGNGSWHKAVRYSLEELMTSKETHLGKFRERTQGQTKFSCLSTNFFVLDDQHTLIGVEYDWRESKNWTLYGMIQLTYTVC